MTQMTMFGTEVEQILKNVDGQFSTPQPGAEQPTSFEFAKYKQKISKIESDSAPLQERINRWRRARNIEIDIKRLRDERRIAANETMIPERVIDKNVTRSVPPYISFLQKSRRFAVFVPQTTQLNTEPLENAFTRACKFKGWERSFYKLVDGSVFLGADAQEILFDERAPGNVVVRHVGRDRINVPEGTEDIEAQDCIIVHQFITSSRLRRFVKKYGWNEAAVNSVLGENGEKGTDECPDKTHDIRKVYCKPDDSDYVYVGYMHPSCDAWLKEPTPLFLGRKQKVVKTVQQPVTAMTPTGMPVTVMQPVSQETWEPVYETQYPVFIFNYRETENKRINEYRGRAFNDEFKQEAATALWSALVNRAIKSADLYASPANPTAQGTGVPKATTNQLSPNVIYDNQLVFWSMPGPEPSLNGAIQQLAANSTDDINQPSWTVNNRRDSEKTATEIQAAQSQESEINTVELTLFSVYLRDLFTRLWEIIKSRAEQGAIKFLDNHPQRAEFLAESYDIFAAGDVDVIKRNEDIQKMRMDWPVISNTAAAPAFLIDYIQKSYPDSAHKYIPAIQQSMQQQQSQAALLKLVQGLMQQFGANMTPEQMAGAQQVIQAALPQAGGQANG